MNHPSTVPAPSGAEQEALIDTPPPTPQRKKPSTTLPDGWRPDETWTEANLPGLSGAQYRSLYERFRDHALATDRRCVDWDAAWRNWVRIEATRGRR
jgi:hypothetical protein